MLEDIVGAPGLDLPALDCAAIAGGYGVKSRVVDGMDELGAALTQAFASEHPELVEVKVAPGMALA
jgi:benzoylformate decarboxylase